LAAGEASWKKIIGIGPEIVKLGRIDGSTVALVAQFIVARALGPRNAGGVMASSDWLRIFLATNK